MKRTTVTVTKAVTTVQARAAALPARLRSITRDQRGDAGGKGLIILVAAVLGLAAIIAVGVLITNQINSRGGGLGQ